MTEVLTIDQTKAVRGGEPSGSIFRVCFVCTGNTCRSPMAQAVANALARKQQEDLGSSAPVLQAFSAGLYACEGEPISPNAVKALENAGVAPVAECDYRDHTAHALSESDAARFDLLIGMSGGHVIELLMRFPDLAKRIVGMPAPISDPFGGDLPRYETCLAEITAGIKDLLFAGADA